MSRGKDPFKEFDYTNPIVPGGCDRVTPVSEFVARMEKLDGECPPCTIAPLAPWYADMLRKKGYAELADEAERAEDHDDARRIAETLDAIKGKVDDEVTRGTLVKYDCFIQSLSDDALREQEEQHG